MMLVKIFEMVSSVKMVVDRGLCLIDFEYQRWMGIL